MPDAERPLVVGAGPVGLGAALSLTRQDQAPRVVEQRTEPTRESRALAINPRTLSLLESTDVTRRMLKLGKPIRGTRFYRRGRVIGELSFAGAHPRYPFMLGLSQAATSPFHRLVRRFLFPMAVRAPSSAAARWRRSPASTTRCPRSAVGRQSERCRRTRSRMRGTDTKRAAA